MTFDPAKPEEYVQSFVIKRSPYDPFSKWIMACPALILQAAANLLGSNRCRMPGNIVLGGVFVRLGGSRASTEST